MYKPKDYWESRFSNQYDLGSVGDISLSRSYNNFLYRVRKSSFGRMMKKLRTLDPGFNDQSHVLDVGSGTGFYLDLWQKVTENYVGSDLTEYATSELKKRHRHVYQFNLTETLPDELKESQFKCVSSFDVLFHIVEDSELTDAFRNAADLLEPGGYFVFSDNLLRQSDAEPFSLGHQKIRTFKYVNDELEKVGFSLKVDFPVFFLMNDPVCSNSRILRRIWQVVHRLAGQGEVAGWIVGGILLPFEYILTRLPVTGPSTEVFIYQKTDQ